MSWEKKPSDCQLSILWEINELFAEVRHTPYLVRARAFYIRRVPEIC